MGNVKIYISTPEIIRGKSEYGSLLSLSMKRSYHHTSTRYTRKKYEINKIIVSIIFMN